MAKSILTDEPDVIINDINQEDLPKQDIIKNTPALSRTKQVLDLKNIKNCPRCNKPLVKAVAIGGNESDSWLECAECGTLVNTFIPTAYQAVFLSRPERYKMTAGGFGSGKTKVDVEDVVKHLTLIPNSRVVVAARTYPALDGTFVKDFNATFPKKLVKSKNDQKHELSLTNGSELIYKSFDDPTKLKSLNASKIVIVEASDVPYDGFIMMQSRLRNAAALIPEYDDQGDVVTYWDEDKQAHRIKYKWDARSFNLETNPSSNWVKSKFLLDANVKHFFGDAYNEGYRFNENPDPNKYVQVVSTSANPHLPEGYEEEQTRGKSEAYIQQMFKGSFNFGDNLVFPNFGLTIVPPKELPRKFNEEGRRVLWYVIGFDYGISDHTHAMFGAWSSETKKLYWYDEFRINNSDIKTLSKKYREQMAKNNTDLDGLLMQPMFDGKSYNKRESDLRTIGDMFEDEGLYFKPAFSSHEARIIKMNALINHGQMETFSTCEFFIEEMLNYSWKLDRRGNRTNKPKDGNDHGITAAEFVVVELPTNLSEINLKAFIPFGTKHTHDKRYIGTAKRVEARYNPLTRSKDVSKPTGYGNNIQSNTYRPVVIEAVRPSHVVEDDEDRALPAYIPHK